MRDTFCHFRSGAKWELALGSGRYAVTVTAGDAHFASRITLELEGASLCRELSLAKGTRSLEQEVEVTDGRLTLGCPGGPERMTKVAAVEVVRAAQ